MLTNFPTLQYRIGKYTITPVLTDELWKEWCYLVTFNATEDQVLIDPGNNFEGIVKAVEMNGNKLLKSILLTHGHHDHVGEVENLAENYQIRALAHKNEMRLIRQSPLYAIRFDNRKIRMPKTVDFFQDENFAFVEGEVIHIIHVPGHTSGSVAFAFDGFVFSGDTLLKELVGRTDLPGSMPEELRGSIEKLFSKLKDTDTIFPGHGKPWMVKDAREWWMKSHINPPKHDTFNATK